MITDKKSLEKLNYIISYPSNFDKSKKYPLIIFLHGAGTRGGDISRVLENPFYEITGKIKGFNFITAAPHCQGDTWFDIFSQLIQFARYIANSDNVDINRVYGMGASMGGYGIWQLAMSCPELFAAIVPICGGGMYWNAARLKNVPIWAFHGDNDLTVDKAESIKMVEAVNAYGGSARLTVYENCGHDAWSKTYENADVYSWLLKYSVNGSNNSKNDFNDLKKFG